jgi:urease accessory protein
MKILTLLVFLSSLVFAHTNTLEHGGFMSGLMHPISGLDHILAMIGVGMLAFYLSKKSTMVLGSFIGAMILSAIAGYNGVMMIGIEEGILISIAVVFAMIGFAQKLPLSSTLIIVAFFGMFHGFAHGAEFTTGNFIAYIAGFGSSTLVLHLTGMAIAYLYSKKVQPSLAK